MNIWKSFVFKQSHILSFTQANLRNHEQIVGTCYDNTLFHKALLLNASTQIKRLIKSDSLNIEKFNQLKSIRQDLAKEYSKPLDNRKNLNELEENANSLEKQLAASIAGFGEAIQPVSWKEVQKTLHPDEASVEFVHFQYHDPDLRDSVMYAALVILPGEDQPHFISLCREEDLANILIPPNDVNRPQLLTAAYNRGVVPVNSQKTEGLYELIWHPLQKLLEGKSRIYFAPSGMLHRINFSAISNEENRFVSDQFQLVRLGSTRHLVFPTSSVNQQANNAVVFGGIQYDADSTAFISDDASFEPLKELDRTELSFSNTDSTFRTGNWNFLYYTAREVETIAKLLKENNHEVETFRDYQATEDSFKSLGKTTPSPKIIHIATHGFFFPDSELNSQIEEKTGQEPIFKISGDPMIRSGLIMAGGNHAWKTGESIKPGMEDGILTAYEISQMDLSNTVLVVLSACETGLGDINGNEGVYGLQRAFKIAGVKYLIMSLWQVPDKETALFYGNLL